MRHIKYFAGSDGTYPIKSKKELNSVMQYLLVKKETAKTKRAKYIAYRNYIMVLVGLNTAFRAEDLLQLRVKDILTGYIDIIENKTGKHQHFPINKEVLEKVKEYVKEYNLTDSQYLFMGTTKQTTYKGVTKKVIYPITRQNARVIMHQIKRACNIKYKFGLHSLRKTFGYQWIAAKNSLLTLQKMYNHDSPDITLLYVCWGTEDMEKARESIKLGL